MYQEDYKRWLEADLEDPDLKPELSRISGNDDEIKERFAVALKFGTAGLRGFRDSYVPTDRNLPGQGLCVPLCWPGLWSCYASLSDYQVYHMACPHFRGDLRRFREGSAGGGDGGRDHFHGRRGS